MSGREECESDNFVEELSFARTGGGTSEFQDWQGGLFFGKRILLLLLLRMLVE